MKVGSRITVDVKDSSALTGILLNKDKHMNLLLQDAYLGESHVGLMMVRGCHIQGIRVWKHALNFNNPHESVRSKLSS